MTGANAANITTSLPSVAERVMFIFKLGSIVAHDTVDFTGIQEARPSAPAFPTGVVPRGTA